MSERAALTKTPENKGKNPVGAKPKENFYESMDSPVEQIFHLQQTIGNQEVQRLIKSGAIQAKLKIGQPNDKYEQEADRVADKVISMPEPKGSLVNCHWSSGKKVTPSIQRQEQPEEEEEKKQEEEEQIQPEPIAEQITPLVQRQVEPEEKEETIQTKLLQRQETEEEKEPLQKKLLQRKETEEEEPVQTKQAPNQTPAVTSNIEASVNSLKGRGQPLSESTRSYFESRFGTDFSQVRVHTGSQEADTAKSINAIAFTKGKDMVFGTGQYSPETSTGKRLLAHELTHVVQQTSNLKKLSLNPTIQCQSGGASFGGSLFDVGDFITDPNLKSLKLTQVERNRIKNKLIRSLSRRHRILLEGLARGGIKIDKWAYLIAQSERENLGRKENPRQNEFNINVVYFFENIRENPLTNRPEIMKWMKKALEALNKVRKEEGLNRLSLPKKRRDWFKLRWKFRKTTTPRTPGSKGIATAAYLLLAYTSYQLLGVFWRRIQGVLNSMRKQLKKVRKADALLFKIKSRREGKQITPGETLEEDQYCINAISDLTYAEMELKDGIEALKKHQPSSRVAKFNFVDEASRNLKDAVWWISSALVEIESLMSWSKMFKGEDITRIKSAKKFLEKARKSLQSKKKNIKSISEQVPKLSYVDKAAFAFLASTGQKPPGLRISGKKEAWDFLTSNPPSKSKSKIPGWRVASQIKHFRGSFEKLSAEIKKLVCLELKRRTPPKIPPFCSP